MDIFTWIIVLVLCLAWPLGKYIKFRIELGEKTGVFVTMAGLFLILFSIFSLVFFNCLQGRALLTPDGCDQVMRATGQLFVAGLTCIFVGLEI
ncbi:MAG: hypothetical protein WCX71_05995 [Candidatus Buchananbacteria bacterium]